MCEFVTNPFYELTRILVGDAGLEKLSTSHVFLAGLGGVGSYTAEALARVGVGRLTLADKDTVAASNLNRQLVALTTTLDQPKACVMADRIAAINPRCVCEVITEPLSTTNISDRILHRDIAAVVDAIDSTTTKAHLLESAWRHGLPVFSAMGGGGKLDPSAVRAADLMDTSVCRLAAKMRAELRRRGVRRGIQAVYSVEPPLPALKQPAHLARTGPMVLNGTVSYVPAIFGLTLAGLVTRHLIGTANARAR